MGNPLLVAVAISAALVAAGLGAVLYQLVKQQGRLLLRLDQLERHLGLEPQQELALCGSSGLEAGAALPDFELPDLEGRPVALESFRGRRVLLVNWSARCGFCDQIAADLAALAPQLDDSGVQLLLVSQGPAAAERELAREHGLECPILLDSGGSDHLSAFSGVGTPAAYFLDEAGHVAEGLAIGAVEVPALARRAVGPSGDRGRRRRRPLTESRIERNGLPAGTPAPPFELPAVHGGTVALDRYRGRKVLLVFSDPHCGPCGQLAPDLVRLHEEHRNNGLDLLLVGRGELEENRRHAEENGFEFPVLVQRRWELSRKYGIFLTPVGFLIDEDGRIVQDVARGRDEILNLARQANLVGRGAGA